MDTLNCQVKKILFSSLENGFTVLICAMDKDDQEKEGASAPVSKTQFRVVGYMTGISEGDHVRFEGEWKRHQRYGMQFEAACFAKQNPKTEEGCLEYLQSGCVKGVGPSLAQKIVDHFGKNMFDDLDEDPERIREVKGFGEKRAEKFIASWKETRASRHIFRFLSANGINMHQAVKIYEQYGTESIETIKKNPYRLIDDIRGVGFDTADSIAQKLGFDRNRPARIRAGIIHMLRRASAQGHCCLPEHVLVKNAADMLSIDTDLVKEEVNEMLKAKDIASEWGTVNQRNIFLWAYHLAERQIAECLYDISAGPSSADVGFFAEPKDGIEYDDHQMKSIRMAVENKVFVLTGGPGTGKTTTLKGIVSAFDSWDAKILLAAPTGRAAKRMEEAIGMEAKTIHRLLEYSAGENKFQRNEDNPLSGDVLVVDECSMIDVLLMSDLVKAIPPTMHLIMVGDVDQLPSVGAGNVLKDIIESETVPCMKLKTVFRQAEASDIVLNAHRVNAGKLPEKGSNDFFMIMCRDGLSPSDTNAWILDQIKSLVSTRLPKYLGMSPDDIQVLTPMRKRSLGTVELNGELQSILNHTEKKIQYGTIAFKKGDKVMQTANNYDKGVFNGDIGVVSAIDEDDNRLLVDFDTETVSYEASDLDELTLAYACTIHKSQGSEYPVVIIPMTMSHYGLLQRNLLYTAISRGKQMVVLVGEQAAVARAVKENNIVKRNSMLLDRLKECFSDRYGAFEWDDLAVPFGDQLPSADRACGL